MEYQSICMELSLHSLKYSPSMLALCWHGTPAYYGFYDAGIFDASLPAIVARFIVPHEFMKIQKSFSTLQEPWTMLKLVW